MAEPRAPQRRRPRRGGGAPPAPAICRASWFAIVALWAGLSTGISACAPGLPAVTPVPRQCREARWAPEPLEPLHAEALQRLTVIPYRPIALYDVSGELHPLTPPPAHAAAVVSYPEPTRDDRWNRAFVDAGRSFVYDDALAAIAFAQAGERWRAEGLLHTLAALQRADGAWGFSFDARGDGFYNAGYVRAGVVAWVAYAMGYWQARTGEPTFQGAASRALDYLVAARLPSTTADPRAGLVLGGQGRWSLDEAEFYSAYQPEVAVTEHQIDAWFAFDLWARVDSDVPRRARWARARDSLARAVERSAFDAERGLFVTGVGPEGPTTELALDTAGAWTALWLGARGRPEAAFRVVAALEDVFGTLDGPLRGLRPYAGTVADYPGKDWSRERLIFVEGTLGAALAARRYGDPEQAVPWLDAIRALHCASPRGLPYASRHARHFPALPSAAATAWWALLLGDALGLDRDTPFWSGAPTSPGE